MKISIQKFSYFEHMLFLSKTFLTIHNKYIINTACHNKTLMTYTKLMKSICTSLNKDEIKQYRSHLFIIQAEDMKLYSVSLNMLKITDAKLIKTMYKLLHPYF